MADAYNRAIGNVSFRGLLDALSPTPIVGDAISGVLGLYDTGKGLLGDYRAAQEKDPRKMIRGMAANTDNYNSGLLNLGSMLPYVTPAVAGMFIGKNSKVWDALKADEAQKMLANGVDPKEVYAKTRTMPAVDNALRQEISDANSSLLAGNVTFDEMAKIHGGPITTNDFLVKYGNTPEANAIRTRNSMRSGKVNDDIPTLFDVLDHPELKAAYPELGSVKVAIDDTMPIGNAAYSKDYNLVSLSPSDNETMRSNLLHELQHAIQEREGWARGGSPDEMAAQWSKAVHDQDYFSTLDALARTAVQDFGGSLDNAAKALNDIGIEVTPEHIADVMRYGEKGVAEKAKAAQEALKAFGGAGKYGNAGHNLYKKLAGEAESRLTQSRMNMTMPERLQVYPYDMLDVPQEQLIVRGLLGQ